MAFTNTRNPHSRAPTSLAIFKRGGAKSAAAKLPKPDPANPDRFVSTTSSSAEFYPEYISLLRNGPLPLITRITSPDKYEQAVFKYQFESKESDLEEAQANMDAFFSAPDVWADQKMREQKGEREVFRYAKPLETEKVLLSVIWGSAVLFAIGKIIWKGILHF